MQEQIDNLLQPPFPNHLSQTQSDAAIIYSHLNNIHSDLLFNSKYLNPFQISLTEGNPKPEENVSQLPKGIEILIKTQGFFSNKYKAVKFQHPNDLREGNRDQINLISYLKMANNVKDKVEKQKKENENGREQRQEENKFLVAICICMYSEDKKMLKETILGVKKNIQQLIKKGYNSDQIGVFVIIDGIQSIHPSIFPYITELQNESLLNFDNFNYYKNGEDISQQQTQTHEKCFDKLKFMQDNTNNFIFKENEYKRFTESRLIGVVKEYKQLGRIRELLKKIDYNQLVNISEDLQRELPPRIKKQFFLKEVQKYLVYNEMLLKSQKLSEEQCMNEYTTKLTDKEKLLVLKDTISTASSQIQKYFVSRQKLSYVAPFRIYLNDIYQISFQNDTKYNNHHMNLFLCVKYKNSGKLSSHNWFFNGFCKQLIPKYSIIMDVGLVPNENAIVEMLEQMISDTSLGGVCGYMGLKLEKYDGEDEPKEDQLDLLSYIMGVFVDIQKAQQMEYNISHIIDKSFEAMFGFIHVLPGAFSGYNMQILTEQHLKPQKNTQKQPLQQYFKSIQQKLISNRIKKTNLTFANILLRIFLPQFIYNYFYPVEQQSQQQMLYNQNVYFAEDRILSIEIFKKQKKLGYIPNAFSLVDPIKSIDRLLGQRKRWINGSFFAYQKVKTVMKKIERCEFKVWLQILFYNFINYLIYLSPSIFFFTINISVRSLNQNHLFCFLRQYMPKQSVDLVLSTILETSSFIYVLILLILIYYSINTTSKDRNFKKFIHFFSSILGLVSIIIILMFIIDSCQNPFTSDPTKKKITNNQSNCNGPQTQIFSPDNASSSLFFLNGNQQWLPSVPILIMVHKIITLSIFGFYVLSVLMYSITFRTFRYIAETVKCTFSFIFYSPTYFIILTIYALCRMDDITWGTKGLQTTQIKQRNLKQKWHQIKLIHVIRYIFWNSAASTIIFILNKQNSPRFYMSFGLVISIAMIIGVKVIIGLMYMICFISKRMKKRQIHVRNFKNQEKERVMEKILNIFKQQCQRQFRIFQQKLFFCNRNFNKALIAKTSSIS